MRPWKAGWRAVVPCPGSPCTCRRVLRGAGRLLVLTLLLYLLLKAGLLYQGTGKKGRYSTWEHRPLGPREMGAKYFVLGRHDDIYMYSAFINDHSSDKGQTNIIITSLDSSDSALDCCVLLDNTTTLYRTSASSYFAFHANEIPILNQILEYFQAEYYYARQYACTVPRFGHVASHVTLTSSTCSPDIRDYLPVAYPDRVPGGLAVCTKILFGGGRDPEGLIEWFEVQRLLGVDKVLIFEMGNPENLTRILKYYESIGMLEVRPYELPGYPQHRGLAGKEEGALYNQHDTTMTLLDCEQRMSGYTYVLSHDLDELIIPRQNISIKKFVKEQLEQHQDAAGFFFHTEFFVFEWGPSHPSRDLMVTRYQQATRPHWECTKFIYLPSRVVATVTHSIVPAAPYTTYKLPSHLAVIHHYRRCPHVWASCDQDTIVDDIMSRYTGLHRRVLAVRAATNTRPKWHTTW